MGGKTRNNIESLLSSEIVIVEISKRLFAANTYSLSMWIYANSTQDMLKQRRYKNKVYRDKAYQKKLNYVRAFVELMQIYRLHMKRTGKSWRNFQKPQKILRIGSRENFEFYVNFGRKLKISSWASSHLQLLNGSSEVIYQFFNIEFVIVDLCLELLSKRDKICFMIELPGDNERESAVICVGCQNEFMMRFLTICVFSECYWLFLIEILNLFKFLMHFYRTFQGKC